jgi:pilus assembly protein CpaE
MKFFAIVQDSSATETAKQVAARFSVTEPVIIEGTIASACAFLKGKDDSPEYVLIDIGAGYPTILEELDDLAQYCQANTKVVVFGLVNDLALYRQLLQRGVIEYYIQPVNSQDIYNSLSSSTANSSTTKTAALSGNGKVISFMAAASGDGATTVAINTAYMLAKDFNQPTVILDMDYQYGMVARNLDLIANNGLKELVEQPEGSIEVSLLDKMAAKYTDNLYVISAPKALRFIPKISGKTIENLLMVLRAKYKYTIVDLPHCWTEWVGGIIGEADHNYMVSQLWLKSAAHASRFLDVAQSVGITSHKTSIVINRSGSKFKEAVTPSEFGAACKKKVDFFISNESKTIINAENHGKTAIEMGNSVLNKQFKEIAGSIFHISN